ncbi:MAG: chemotaxis protein CheC [Candidatus Omnitrophica bacterium]|nr:chemotaxis protein CheC [Candidatus Omnitrophota bacterium]
MDKTHKVDKAIELIARISIDRASQSFSKIIKSGAKIELESIFYSDVTALTEEAISLKDEEVIGAFVNLAGDAPFRFLFYVPVPASFLLADLILKNEPGTTKELDEYAKSAVQELGNILASSISNTFAKDFDIKLKVTPPVLVTDLASILLQEYIINAASGKDRVLVIKSAFKVIKFGLETQMYIVPTAESERILSYLENFL